MKNNSLVTTKINLPMSIIQENKNDFLITCPLEELAIFSDAATFDAAIEEAKEILMFTLFDRYKDNESIPTITQQELDELENTKKENEFILLVETNLKEIVERFEKVNS